MPRLTALDAQNRMRRRILDLRAMARILETPRFEQAVEKATDDQLTKLETILKSDSTHTLKEWIKTTMNLPLHLRSMRELKEMARDRMVPKWSRMTRPQLVKALERT